MVKGDSMTGLQNARPNASAGTRPGVGGASVRLVGVGGPGVSSGVKS